MSDTSSPNFDSRAPGVELRYIVLHYTGMIDAESALARLRDPSSRVSAHYVVDENGAILHLVDESKRAWHAGKSCWHGIKDMNSASIGIELVNPGHEFGYRPFPAAQISALKDLARNIMVRHRMSMQACLVAHSDIAPSRKQDPGELFPWRALARDGLGVWPEPWPQDYGPATEGDIVEALDAIGYDTECLFDTIRAFQRHYFPENISEVPDQETVARLRALKRQMIG